MAYETTLRVSVPNLKLFGPIKTELRVKKLKNFLLSDVISENGPVLLPTNMAASM